VKAPPPVGKNRRQPVAQRAVWAGSIGLLAVIAIVVSVLVGHGSSPKTAPPATPSAADRNAPASLIAAANAVGFHPTTEPGVGVAENEPASAATAPTSTALLPVGSTAPDFTLKTPQGKSVSLSDYRGKAVLLEFFATWCPHCNAEAPHLRKLYASLPKGKVAFISVNADGESAPSVFAFHRYYGLAYPALVDSSSHPGSFNSPGSAGPVSTKYGVEAFPTFYVISPKGKIVWRSDGEQPDVLLKQLLVQAEPSA
jgi:peroxiredoxin